MVCSYCSKQCKNLNSLRQHEIRCKLNPNKIIVKSNFIGYNNDVKQGKRDGSNQYIKATKEGKIIVVADETKKKIAGGQIGLNWSDERKAEHSKTMQAAVQNHPESYSAININGRVKKVEYKGVSLDGGWELLVAKWLDENKISWKRNLTGFGYEWNGPRTYYPDFYLKDYDLYIEVKGYARERDLIKWSVVSNLIVIKKNEINKIKKNIEFIKLLKELTVLSSLKSFG